MLKSILGLADDVMTIATAAVKIAINTTRAVTKPLSDAAKDTVKAVEELTEQDDKD